MYIGINAHVTDVTTDGNVKIELESAGFAISHNIKASKMHVAPWVFSMALSVVQ